MKSCSQWEAKVPATWKEDALNLEGLAWAREEEPIS